jgi:hypothetical protein
LLTNKWGWASFFVSYFVTYFVICLNHMIQEFVLMEGVLIFPKFPYSLFVAKFPNLHQFALFNKSRPVFFSQLFVLMEGVVIFPKLHKLSLVAPPSMRY